MALTAQQGIFGFGPQPIKDEVATTFYKHKASVVDFDINDDVRIGPLEIGGSPFPTFPYKAGYATAGGATIQPRLEDTVGWLLYAALGDVASVAVGGTAAYDHTFKPLDSDYSLVRWLTLKKYIPEKEADDSTDLGEIFEDCKLVGLSLALENDQPLTARLDFLGRQYEIVEDPSGWVWENEDYEDWESIPVGCEVGGYLKFTGGGMTAEELPVVRATVSLQNQPLDLRMEKVYGDPMLEDISIVTRQQVFDVIVKWNNPELYQAVLTGDIAGTDWTTMPLTGSLAVNAVATGEIGVTGYKYQLAISAPNILWQLNGPIALAAGQAVLMRFTGTALEPDDMSVDPYVTWTLRNAVTSYTWPTIP